MRTFKANLFLYPIIKITLEILFAKNSDNFIYLLFSKIKHGKFDILTLASQNKYIQILNKLN
jgi:hypothetical protein